MVSVTLGIAINHMCNQSISHTYVMSPNKNWTPSFPGWRHFMPMIPHQACKVIFPGSTGGGQGCSAFGTSPVSSMCLSLWLIFISFIPCHKLYPWVTTVSLVSLSSNYQSWGWSCKTSKLVTVVRSEGGGLVDCVSSKRPSQFSKYCKYPLPNEEINL